jgi:peptidyl-dipeptidase Dcp
MLKSLAFSFVGVAALAAASSSPVQADSTATPATAAAPAAAPADHVNPFMQPSTLDMQAPPFDKILDSDYQPALDEGMTQQQAEVQAIVDNPEAPTFDNTIAALEKSGQLLIRVERVFYAMAGANTNDTIDKVQADEAPKLSAHQDSITLNPKLFARIETLYKQRAKLKLDPEQMRLVEYYYEESVLAGAKLNAADKEKLKQYNAKEASLTTDFSQRLLKGSKAGGIVVDDPAKLAGLTQGQMDAAQQAAEARGLKGKWLLTLRNTTNQPLLQSLTDRATREKLFDSSWMRTERGDENDTRDIILQLAMVRAEKAKLLGFKTYADWKLQDQMAKKAVTVTKFLAGLVPPAVARARGEAADIQKLIDQQHGGFKLQPWDWDFYSEQVRKAKYDLDESQIAPYFELNRVLEDGVFYAANQLYGLTFKERKDLPVYNPDVRVFTVYDKDGSVLGLFYCDYYKRDNKSGGAWMDNFVGQSKMLGQKPVVFNVTNFTKPAPGQPALLSWDDVTTMFHEFGHALHGLFGSQEYPTLSGAQTARDWVEFPSQFNEHWASDPKVFAHFAVHYQTGKPMPKELVDKIKKAALFNGGFSMTEILGATDLDMQWHTLTLAQIPGDVDEFELGALARTHLDFRPVPPRYRTSYFAHVWGGGYAAGYYAYTWTRMLADDAFSWFEEHGGLSRKNGDRFRAMILSRGNTEDYNTMFKAFRGRAPSLKPFLKDHGLTGGKK